MKNFVAILAVIMILGLAIAYIVCSKKKGVKCIGCPFGSECSGNCTKED